MTTPNEHPPFLRAAVRSELGSRLTHFTPAEIDDIVDALNLGRFARDGELDLEVVERVARRFAAPPEREVARTPELAKLLINPQHGREAERTRERRAKQVHAWTTEGSR